MRIWDIPCSQLCNKHLLGEHHELHVIYSVIANKKKGYSNHPEVKRWKGKLRALSSRHYYQVQEMKKRNINHKSPLPLADGDLRQNLLITSINEQIKILKEKECECLK